MSEFYQLTPTDSHSPAGDGLHSELLFDTEINLNDSIDLCNEDTFGLGAVEDDWEFEHNQFVGHEESKQDEIQSEGNLVLKIPKPLSFNKSNDESFGRNPLVSPSQLNDEELELSNQQLAAAVEELVLNSDLDQDSIDPAIVSLRRQAPKPNAFPTSPELPPHYETKRTNHFSNPTVSALFGQPSFFNGTTMQNIWNKNPLTQSKVDSLLPLSDVRLSPPLQDEAILTAIRDKSSGNNPLFSGGLVVKAEDLERELQASPPRCPSPTFGISIPKRREDDNGTPDRSLPARSVSPVFGSPSPSTMPIGTPPKHVIMDMMHQLEQQQKMNQPTNSMHPQGASGSLTRPPFMVPPGMPLIFNQLPPPLNGARMPVPPGNLMWPPNRPGVPIGSLVAQDVINRLGLRMPPPAPLHSPIGSPRRFPPRMMTNRNAARPMPFPPGGVLHSGMRPSHRGFMNGGQRFRQMPPQFGPGHLHPEHSKFVRMRQERHNNRYNQRNYNQRGQNREDIVGVPGDPYANIMTQKEKDWVIRIQMMALQSDRPEIDDYYYQNYIERRLREGKLNPDDSAKPPQRLITPTNPNVDNRKYVPVQFVNSLGKLTTSSVYNPRQIIDVGQSPNQDDDTTASEPSADNNRQALSKRLVVYKRIEKAYDLIVKIEELEGKLSECGDLQSSAGINISDELKLNKNMVVEVLGFHDTKASDLHSNPIFQVLKIRKGKKLLTRAMPFLSQDYLIMILITVFSHLPILIKRDAKDKILYELYPPISNAISSTSAEQFINLTSKLSTFALTAALKDQVGASIVCKMLESGKKLFISNDSINGSEEWQKFVSDVCDVIIAVANPKEGSRHARPSTPLPLLEVFQFDVLEILQERQNQDKSMEELKSSFERLIAIKGSEG